MTESQSPRWRPDAPAGGPAGPHGGRVRRAWAFGVFTAAAFAAGVAVGLLWWYRPAAVPEFVPVWVGAEAATPGRDADRLEFAEPALSDPAAPARNRDQLRLLLAGLAGRPRGRPVVATVFAPAAVADDGAVDLLPNDPAADHPRNRLTLADLLAAVAGCPADRKLLVLHLTPPPADPAAGGDLAAAVARAVRDRPDVPVLLACEAGQVPYSSPELGRTVFGYYVDAGLRGGADGWGGGGERDGRVTVRELAAFVRGRVGRWAAGNRLTAQTPVLVGPAADFVLRTLPPGGPADPAPLADPVAYPDWLQAGWATYDQWLAQGRDETAPGAARQLELALLDAERSLRDGRAADDVRRLLQDRTAKLDARAGAASAAVRRPNPPPTLALAGAVPGDPALADDLRQTLGRAPAESGKPGAAPQPDPAWDALKAKPHPAVAAAAVEVLSDEATPAAVRRVADLLAGQVPAPKFAETLLVRRLADLAANPGPDGWPAAAVAQVVRATRDFEASTARPDLFPWLARAADDAAHARRAAEAVLFAPGYAPRSEVVARARAAVDAGRRLRDAAAALTAAHAALRAGWRTAAAAGPLVAAQPSSERAGLDLADALRVLAETVHPPQLPAPLPAGGDELIGMTAAWKRATAAAVAANDRLVAVVRRTGPNDLVTRAATSDAGPDVLADLDAALATLFPATADRPAVWAARSTLARRLADATLTRDRLDDHAVSQGTARPGDGVPPTFPPSVVDPADEAVRRVRWSAIRLRLAAANDDVLPPDVVHLAGRPIPAGRLATARRVVRQAWADVGGNAERGADGGDAAARLAVLGPATGPDPRPGPVDRDPGVAGRVGRARALWRWTADHFAAEAANPLDPVHPADGRQFARRAAEACGAVAAPGREPERVDVAVAAPVGLTPEARTTQLALRLRLLGGSGSDEARVHFLTPTATGLVAPPDAGPVRLDATGTTVRVTVRAGPRPEAHPGVNGLLAEVSAGGRTVYERVPVDLSEVTNRLDLFVRSGPGGEPLPVADLRVRPVGTPVPYTLVVRNPAAMPRTVVVRVPAVGAESAPVALGPGEAKEVALVAPPPPPAPPASPQPAAAPPPAPGPELADLSGPLRVEILHPETKRQLQHFTVPVRVADSVDTVRVESVRFVPAADRRGGRVEVRVAAAGDLPGGPCVVELAAARPGRDAAEPRDGKLKGELPASGSPLTLYVDDPAATAAGLRGLVVTLAVDGVPRAFTFVAAGDPVQFVAETGPKVRVRPVAAERGGGVWYPPANKPFRVLAEVDRPPAGASLTLEIGTDRDGTFAPDVSRTVAPARRRAVAAGVAKGAILLRATAGDRVEPLAVAQLFGPRVLRATVRDATGAAVVHADTAVVFDEAPPVRVRFLDPPDRARWDQPVRVRAACDPGAAGVKEVRFFLGNPPDDPAAPLPPGVPSVPGKPVDAAGLVWEADVPTGGAKGPVTVGVRFTSRTGVSATRTTSVELADPAELAKPKPGRVVGTVLEGTVRQPKLEVVLTDEKNAVQARTTTDAAGAFAFENVPPGKYKVVVTKEATGRRGEEAVDVKPGRVSRADVDLYL